MPGEIKVKWHRPFQGRCKQVHLKKESGKFYIILSCDDVPTKILEKTGKAISLDLGLNSFITTDDGTKFHHPKPWKTAKEKLSVLNRKLALKQRGSNNRKKAKQSLARAYERVSNIRADFLHKMSHKLVKENDIIILEDLNIQNMMTSKNQTVKKSNITDASWGAFSAMLSYKAERAGRKIIKVNPKNTSKRCSCCGKIKESLILSDRMFNCEFCSFSLDRDHNAALNIKRLGTSLAIFE